MAIVGFDTSVLLNYYAARTPQTPTRVSSSALGSTALPPWTAKKPPQEVQDVAARSNDPYFDPKDLLLQNKSGQAQAASSQLEALLKNSLLKQTTNGADPSLTADNDKLFALYSALTRLDTIAQMANRDGTFASQRPGLDKDFQDGLKQIQTFVKSADFANLNVMAGVKAASVKAGIAIAYPTTTYIGGAAVKDDAALDPVAGVSASDSFTIRVTKAGVTTDVAIDLANVSGPLTLDNIDAYVNQQLQAGGFSTRFARVQTGGDLTDGSATWGIKIAKSPTETVSLSSAAAAPAVYVAGSVGKTDDQQGRLLKLTNLGGTPQSSFSENIEPDSDGSTAAAKATAVDANGNVFVIGNTNGSFGSELNQGSQDVFLSKYDSAGTLQWTKLLGAADNATAYGLAVDPTSGGVVVSGAVTGKLTPNAIGGKSDSFVAKYDRDGNQSWLRQIAPASNDRANAVSVDAAGNIYVGGQTDTTIASGQTSAGGTDAYITKLSKTGTVLYQRQFGTAGSDAAAKTTIADDGNLVVASVQNGHAVLTKYSSADGVSAPMWQIDLGDLQGGTIGGIAAANGHIYLTGNSANVSLDAGGAATIARPSSGGSDAFVFSATDAGTGASADFVSYVGTGGAETGGGVAVANGKVYVTGSTTGTFAGETKSSGGTHNLFVAQLSSSGSLDWAHQYGGLDGESAGAAIAADTSGSSVLDALKLPRGTIGSNPSNLIESSTTARAGDSFTLKVNGRTGTRETKITIAKGETLRSLALKINSALLFDGKAKTLGVKGGQGLQIAVNTGVTAELIAGPKDFDALAGLGLKPQTLVHDASDDTKDTKPKVTDNAIKNKDTTSSTDTGPQTVGLGIDATLSLTSKDTAAHAHVVIMAAQSLIKQAYSKLNAPPGSTTTQPTGPVPAYLQNQISGYQTALAWLTTMNGG